MFENLYRTLPGRMLARVIATPCITRMMGRIMDSRLSARLVPLFIRKNQIDMSEALPREYTSFNDFFTRRLKPGSRPVGEGLVCPCDGLLSVYPMGEDTQMPIKGYRYTVRELTGGAVDPTAYAGGVCLVFRLTPAHYHRYIYPCDGEVTARGKIPGIFHTVRPLALQYVPVFKTNTREFIEARTEAGRFLQMEVGAALVGRIVNEDRAAFKKGEEKGRFEFGGSTIVLMLSAGMMDLDPALISGDEVPVRLGQPLARRS